MKSFRAARAVCAVALAFLAGAAQGQIYPASSPLYRLPPVDPAPVYAYPQLSSYDQTGGTYAQSMAAAYPRRDGLTTLIGTPPVDLAAAEPIYQIAPQPVLTPLPSNVPNLGQPNQYDFASSAPVMTGPITPYAAPAVPYASPENPYNVYGSSKGSSFGIATAACGKCGQRPCCCACCWFAAAYGLVMTRDDENPYYFSYDSANEAIQLTNSRDSNFDAAGGVAVHFGRYFNCGLNAVEAVYWGLYPDRGVTTTTTSAVAGDLNGILNWGSLNYNGATADAWVNDAQVHAVYRENEIHNLEVNFLRFSGCCPQDVCCGSALQYHWLAGVRYFDFRDDLAFGADTVDSIFTGAPEEIYYRIQTDNNLIGFQVGGEAEYPVTSGLALDCGVKLGVYDNYIVHDSEIGGAAGVAVINFGPNLGRTFAVHNSKNDVAFLGELNVGLQYCLSPNWTARGGYRAVAVTGVALPTEQIYPDLRGIQDVEVIDSNGSLILHGAYAGLEYNF